MIIRDALKLLATFLLFALLTFIAIELTLRVYMFGIAGLSPAKVSSFRNIFDSGLVQPAENLEVWYELKPNVSELFRGALLTTNSRGLPDEEYALAKPKDTFRVVVIGSSWTMGAGVAQDEVFHSVLEREFNAESTRAKYEFISFGVENYGLGEMVGTLRHKALAYDPDMILFVVTGSTPAILWEEHTERFTPLPVTDTRWASYTLIRLRDLLGLKTRSEAAAAALRNTLDKSDNRAYARQFLRAANTLKNVAAANNVKAASIWLRVGAAGNQSAADMFMEKSAELNIVGTVIDLESFLEPGEPLRKLLVNRVEKHPNAKGHEIIAHEIYRGIFNNQLPVPAN